MIRFCFPFQESSRHNSLLRNRKLFLSVITGLLLPGVFHFGSDGVFVAEPISNVIGGTACMVTMLLMVLPELRKME